MTRSLYDSVNVSCLPANAQMVAGYLDGRWPTFTPMVAKFPNATHVSITVTGLPKANVCDCETGDLTPAQAAQWARNELAAGRLPTIYMNSSTWPLVRQALGADAGRVSYWVAQYDNLAQLMPGAVAKQYRSDTNLNLDFSVVADYWPGVDPAPSQEDSIMALLADSSPEGDSFRGGLVRLTYWSTKHREPTVQEWGLGKLVLAQDTDLDTFVRTVGDNGQS